MIEAGSLSNKGLDFVYSDDPLDIFLLQSSRLWAVKLP